jgi:serine protease AprX
VAAWDDKNTPTLSDDGITWWSSRGGVKNVPHVDQTNKPNIAGLGNQMVSLRSPSSYLDQQNLPHYDAHHVLMSGTSMATPWVAGGIADILSVNPNLTVQQVFDIVAQCGYALPGESSLVQGRGLLNVPKACTLAEALKTNQSAA